MAKSFCANCAYWWWRTPNGKNYEHYCTKFNTLNILERKEKCNGKYKKEVKK